MKSIYIKNGNVILKDRIINGVSVRISGAKISAVGGVPRRSAKGRAPRNDAVVIDAKGCFVSPGFIDCHIHGEPRKIMFNEAQGGTTAFIIAESCAPLNLIYKKIDRIKEFIRFSPLGENVLGVRLEGPYINRKKAGAQNIAYIRKPDTRDLHDILQKCKGVLKIMTVAPELKGVRPILNILRKNGVIASIGHSDATYEEAHDGMGAGITHATHTFNAMSGIDRRDPGVVGAVLFDDRITAEVILDLIHVHRAMFGLLLKLKKKDKVIIVTDSIVSEPQEGAEISGGAYRFNDGKLAGSTLMMIDALKNAVKGCNIELLDALKFITINPAKLLGVEHKKGSIAAGKDADIVIFDKDFNVKMTMIRGKIAYEKKGFACAG